MAVLKNVARGGKRLAGDVHASVKRGRLEGERRLLERRRRHAAEKLGEKVWELAKAGAIDPRLIGEEIRSMDDLLIEITGTAAEIDALNNSAK